MKKLNEILAAAEVSATNIKARHWMVTGPHFYSIHLMLDDVYKTLQKGIDAVAERLRVLGYAPLQTWAQFAEASPIEPSEPIENSTADMTLVALSRNEVATIVRLINDGIELEYFDPTTESILTNFSTELSHHLLFLDGTVNYISER